ncbi:OprO/OprP family phosphate-selective porin [Pseudomonas sp. NPDC089554]|uniref:OprO/OprP family phosphate-selective porin n=1 Tax=Pseudomonas sp. NPDC089554 TaxID=3390653 RepID=UPI003D0050A5
MNLIHHLGGSRSGFSMGALALMISAQSVAGTVTTDGADLIIKTKGGFQVATTDKQFSFQIGGLLQADYGQFDGVYSKNGKAANEAYLRRARLALEGKVYGDWAYEFSIDFADDGTTSWKEASVSYLALDPVTVKVGRFDPDFGLEQAISSKWTTAMERSLLGDLASWVTDHADGMGVQVSGSTEMFYGAAGFNRPKGQEDKNGKNTNTYNVRTVFAPWAEPGNVLHLGVDYAVSDIDKVASNGRIRSRLGVRGTSEDASNGNRVDLAPSVAGAYDGDAAWGLEAAWAQGPLSVQAEYLRRDLTAASSTARNDRKATGYYGQVAYTLTGEPRGYKLDGGKFDRVKPSDKQLGAWELFYRFDHAKVEEQGYLDNRARLHTLGVNWYANDLLKISANYVKTKVDGISNQVGDDSGDAVAVRLQYVF